MAKLQILICCICFLHHTLPASSTLCCRLPAPKPNLSGAFHENASTPLSTCSRRVGRSSVDSSGCLGESSKPASFLQRIFTDKGPHTTQTGQKTQDTNHSFSHTHSTSIQEQFWREKNYNPIQADTTFDTVQQHHHLTHY